MMRSLLLLSVLGLLATAGAQAPSGLTPARAASTPVTPPLVEPRVYSEGSMTRVVYDLPPGVNYELTPSYGGLRVDFHNVRATASFNPRLGAAVGQYRAVPLGSSATVNLSTPFPLGQRDGWRAGEATIAAGTRVLILELGPAVSGGQKDKGSPLTASARPSVTVSSPAVSALPSRQAIATLPASNPIPASPVQQGQPVPADQLAPGDTVNTPATLPAPAASLPGADEDDPNVLSGRALGSPQAGATLSAPRIGKNPGVTRVVLDLPPGASFNVQPGSAGLNIDLQGVTASAQTHDGVSPELRGWRYSPNGAGLQVTLLTAAGVTAHSGWRSVFLPPVAGSSNSRLAIDLSPAFANNTPLKASEKVLAAVPPLRSSALTFSGAGLTVAPTVVIDPGHGGIDPGAVGAVVEKEVNLDIALRVRRYLQAAGVNVIMSRDRDTQISLDKATDLNARAALGYHGAQLFLSIHSNSMPAVNVLQGYGVETWWNNNHPGSAAFAALIQNNVVAATGAFSQGLKTGRSLAVLRGSRVPAALVEVGFVGHPVDGNNLKDDNYRERVALGIARGVRAALVSGLGAAASN